MAGIVGLFDLRGARAVDPTRLERMARRLAHRGGGGAALWRAPGVGLGHLRSRSEPGARPTPAQPRIAADGQAAVCLDGVLYNARALRRSLEAGGARLRCGDDAEILLEGHRLWGPRLPDRLDGAFAAAIWTAGALTLIRDRLGERPLYCAETPEGWLLFASEPEAAAAGLGARPSTDLEGLAQHLALGAQTQGRTLLAGVRALAPGSIERRRPGAAPERRRWWRPTRNPVEPAAAPAEAAAELDALLSAAVAKRLRAAPGSGVALSADPAGAGLALWLAEAGGPGFPASALVFDDPDLGGARQARAAARAAGAALWLDRSAALSDGDLSAFVRAAGGSAACEDAVEIWARSAAAGGRMSALLHPAGAGSGALALRPAGGERAAEGLRRRLARAVGATGDGGWAAVQSLLSAEARRALAAFGGADPVEDEALDGAALVGIGALERLAAAAGLEAQSPFLDRDVVAFVLRAPEPRAGGRSAFAAALDAALRRRVPPGALHGPSARAADPFAAWRAAQLRIWLPRLARHPAIGGSDLFDAAAVQTMATRAMARPSTDKTLLWRLAVYAAWVESDPVR